MQQTWKKKLDVDFHPYRILGARNPKMAYQALQAEDKIGTMLPCNVILQERDSGRTEISAVDLHPCKQSRIPSLPELQ